DGLAVGSQPGAHAARLCRGEAHRRVRLVVRRLLLNSEQGRLPEAAFQQKHSQVTSSMFDSWPDFGNLPGRLILMAPSLGATLIWYSSHSLSMWSNASNAGSETSVSMPMSLANSNVSRSEGPTPKFTSFRPLSASRFLSSVRAPALSFGPTCSFGLAALSFWPG